MKSCRCKDCAWFDTRMPQEIKDTRPTLGKCRKRYPIMVKEKSMYFGVWPHVDEHDLCGEHRTESK